MIIDRDEHTQSQKRHLFSVGGRKEIGANPHSDR